MIRVRVFDYYRHAEYYFKEWTREHGEDIIGMNRRNLMVLTRSGDELHFVPMSGFDKWSRGRKYKIEQWGTHDE